MKSAYDTRAGQKLDAQQLRLLERSYRGFVRAVARRCSDADRAEVSRLNQALASTFSDFSRRLLADEETWIVLDGEAQPAGLPDSFKASLASAAADRGLAGKWAVVNTRSSVSPFLTYSTDRGLRERCGAPS